MLVRTAEEGSLCVVVDLLIDIRPIDASIFMAYDLLN